MACDLKPSIERMRSKLFEIEDYCVDAQFDSAKVDTLGQKYMIMSKAIGQIPYLVSETITVREYLYAKFVEDGVLKPCDGEGAVATQKEAR